MSKKRILAVDDSAIVRNFVMMALEGDFDVTVAESGEKALSLAKVEEPYILFLLDIELPNMDGFEIAQAIRELDAYKETPIIFLTMHSRDDLRDKAKEAGGLAVLSKPNHRTLDKLREAVEEYI